MNNRIHRFTRSLLLPFIAVPLLVQAQEEEKSYQGRLWTITGNGAKDTSYLYGTFHAQDARVYQFPEGTMKALEKSDAYAEELNLDSIDPMSLLSQLMMEGDTTLKDLYSEEEYEEVKSFIQDSLGAPMQRFEKMQPMYASSLIQVRELRRDSAHPLDMYFHNQAKKQEKEIIGLEKSQEQIEAFHSVPYQEQAQQFLEMIRGEGKGEMSELLRIYVEGDLDELLRRTTEGESEAFEEEFLSKRNRRMVDRASEHLEEKRLFIAVGAAHLPGDIGMVEMFREKGYTVRSAVAEESEE